MQLKLGAYEQKIQMLSLRSMEKLENAAQYTTVLNQFIKLSNDSVAIAGKLVSIADKTAEGAVYLQTLETMTATTLRLSDDIGKMADRILFTEQQIGVMADRIGDMSERILETQRIQSRNLKLVAGLTGKVIDKFGFDSATNTEKVNPHRPENAMSRLELPVHPARPF